MTERIATVAHLVDYCLTFDGRTYKTVPSAERHEREMRQKLITYLRYMPHSLCYEDEEATCIAYYVTDAMDWVMLKHEVERFEDEQGYYSLVKYGGLERLYRMKMWKKTKEISVFPYEKSFIESGKLKEQIGEINKMRENYKKGVFFDYETKCRNLCL